MLDELVCMLLAAIMSLIHQDSALVYTGLKTVQPLQPSSLQCKTPNF